MIRKNIKQSKSERETRYSIVFGLVFCMAFVLFYRATESQTNEIRGREKEKKEKIRERERD